MPDHPIPSAALPLAREAMEQVARRSLEIAKQKGAGDAEGGERPVGPAGPIARHTAEADAAGLPRAEQLFRGEAADLDLFHPWGLTVEQSIELAKRCEAGAPALDRRLTNYEGHTDS